jgi:hypothetical protein
MRRALVLILAVTPGLARSQNPPAPAVAIKSDTVARPTITAARRVGEIVLDGRLDEAAWQAAAPSGQFMQSYPKPNTAPTDSTSIRVLYDDAALYVGIRMMDAHPDSIAAQLARRDAGGIYSDWVHLIIDSYHDRRTAFRFTVNPKGVKKDVYTSNDGQEDVNWDAIWDVGTRVDSLGWTAEYRIPLSQLRFGNSPTGPERLWGFQVMRDIARRQERDSWSPWTQKDAGFVSRFGDLNGLVNVPTPQRLEVVPYVSTRLTRAPGSADNPFFKSNDVKPSLGGDLRYGLPAGLTLTATVNPDFGQVEVDPSVVNLSAFETFFPEKRPFFLEGSDVFSFGNVYLNNDFGSVRYFYTRRIGRVPQRFPGGANIRFAKAPDATTIDGAAKITGKTRGWTVGLLDAVTPEEKADVLLTDGTQSTTPVEPFTNYFVGRLKHDFRGGASTIGGMVTSTIRSVDKPEFTDILRSSATFGGIDFEHDIQKRTWITTGYLAGSHVAGSANAIASTQLNSSRYYQRPDQTYLKFDPTRTSLDGHIGEIALAKTGTVYGSLAAKEVSPGLELNDIGFHGRVDYRAFSTDIGYQDFKLGQHFRSFGAYGYTNHTYNFGNTSIYQGVGSGAYATLTNFWNASLSAGFNPHYFSDRFTRGGPLALVPGSWNAGINGGSDTRKPISANASLYYSHGVAGDHSTNYSLYVDMRPSTSLHVTLSPGLGVQQSTGQFVRSVSDALAATTFGRRYVFANLHQTTLSMDTRVEWTFTPAVSLQVYAQPFVSAGRYSSFKEFRTPGTYDFDVYGANRGTIARSSSGVYTVDPDGATGAAPAFSFGDPNFNVRNLRGNAVLRWEYRPGSAIFVVWQQQRSGFEPIGDFDTSRDVGAIFRTVPTNVFLIKATYWIGR